MMTAAKRYDEKKKDKSTNSPTQIKSAPWKGVNIYLRVVLCITSVQGNRL